jgi:hypothetical protein
MARIFRASVFCILASAGQRQRNTRTRSSMQRRPSRPPSKDNFEATQSDPARKTIDMEGRLVKDGVRKAITDRKTSLTELVHAIGTYRKLAESKPLTLQGSDYADAVSELNKAIDRAETLLQ